MSKAVQTGSLFEYLNTEVIASVDWFEVCYRRTQNSLELKRKAITLVIRCFNNTTLYPLLLTTHAIIRLKFFFREKFLSKRTPEDGTARSPFARELLNVYA